MSYEFKPRNVRDGEIKKCGGCGAGLGVTFWLVTYERAIISNRAVSERAGIAAITGSAVIADVLAGLPIAKTIDPPSKICVCEMCACRLPLAAIAEAAEEAGPEYNWRKMDLIRDFDAPIMIRNGDVETRATYWSKLEMWRELEDNGMNVGEQIPITDETVWRSLQPHEQGDIRG